MDKILIGKILLIVLVLSISFLLAIFNLGAMNTKQIQFSEVYYASNSGIDTKIGVLISDQGTWESMWKNINSISSALPPIPQINFEQTNLIAVSMGMKPSGGFRISVTGFTLTGNTLQVDLEEKHPGKNCGVTLALTQPIQIVKFSKIDNVSALNLRFARRVSVINC